MKLSTWVLLACLAAAPVQAQDPCSAATASVTIANLEVGEGAIAARGTWQAGGGAAGVLLEYRVDNGRTQMESRSGASGSWDLPRIEFGECGRHTLRVHAYPSVQDGPRLVHCVRKGTSTPRQFEISCTPVAAIVDCQWECSAGEAPRCSGICAAEARGGRPNYLPFWGLNGEGWQASSDRPSKGPWSHPVTCTPGQRISFKVRDRNGQGLFSEVDELGCGVTE